LETIKTSESVCQGHPDKLCDQISDAILDAVLAADPKGRVAIETLATKDLVVLAGELTTTAIIDLEQIARRVIVDNGYTKPEWGFHDGAQIISRVQAQSPEIAQGVDAEGAGDQGISIGYAVNETPNLMPLPIALARAITARLDTVRKSGALPWLRPDGKAQVSVLYRDDKPVEIVQITVACAHAEEISADDVTAQISEQIIKPALAPFAIGHSQAKVIVNGTGLWYIPGPATDAGLTGRKIVVDAYGPTAPVGGGAFSGKDPSKVDRSGAYAARYLAKQIVSQGLAEEATVKLAWAIGLPEPLAVEIITRGGTETEGQLIARCREWLPFNVAGIIEKLSLHQPIYEPTAAHGHFGHENLPWEKLA
jgi:S-adenosylmethionine synthetase